MVNKKLIIAIIIIIFLVGIIGGNFIYQAESTSVNMDKINAGYITMSAGHALIFIAKEKGFFEDQNLSVNVQEFTTGNDELNALSSGKLDVAVDGVGEALIQMNHGKNFTFIGGVESGDHAVIAKNDEIAKELQNDPNKYKNYKIGTVAGTPAEVITLGFLNNDYNIKKDQLDIIEFKTAADVVNGLKSDKIDVGLVYPAFQYQAEKEGLSIVNWTDELIPGLPDCRVTINADELTNETQDKWVRYMKSLIKAYDFYKSNHTETLEIVKKYVPLADDLLNISTYNDHLAISTDPYEKGTQEIYDILTNIGYVDGSLDVSSHFNTTIYEIALNEMLKEDPNNPNYLELKTTFDEQKLN
ncbi:MAG: ABC transporter substrate-binding protein [Methanobrevibacter sp.]|jgi:NitT/TauT family transport system substrate-binding protein|nr:ABC transporter substrate-binding protein [Candidatus Methanoflexus mossambicus]